MTTRLLTASEHHRCRPDRRHGRLATVQDKHSKLHLVRRCVGLTGGAVRLVQQAQESVALEDDDRGQHAWLDVAHPRCCGAIAVEQPVSEQFRQRENQAELRRLTVN